MSTAWRIFANISAVILLLEIAVAIAFCFSAVMFGNEDRRRARRRR